MRTEILMWLKHTGHPQISSPWFQTLRWGKSPHDAHLFALPYAGGSATALRSLKEVIHPDIHLHIATLPGRGSRFGEPALHDINTIVRALTDTIEQHHPERFVIFGHSMGGLLGFEICQELTRRGRTLPTALVTSGTRAPHLFAKDREITHDLPRDAFIAHLRKLAGTPPEILAHPELMELMLPMLRCDFRLCQTYQFKPSEPLNVPLLVLSGSEDDGVNGNRIREWRIHTRCGCRFHEFSGGHFFLHDHWPEIGEMLNLLLGVQKAVPAPASVAESRH